MVKLYPVSFRRADLAHVPPDALLYHFLLAQVTNSIIILRKQSIAALTGVATETLEGNAGAAIAHLSIMFLAGRLREARLLLAAERFVAARNEVHPKMDISGREAFKSISRYFNAKDNILIRMRDLVSFHVDLDVATRAMERIEPELEIVDYMAIDRGNSFYGSGAVLTAYQLAELAGENGGGDAFEKLLDDVREVSLMFEDYASAFMFAFSEIYLGADIESMEAGEITIDAPHIRDVRYPYFMDGEGLTPEELGSDT